MKKKNFFAFVIKFEFNPLEDTKGTSATLLL